MTSTATPCATAVVHREKLCTRLYGVAGTFSLSREMQLRTLAEIQPGDVYVYPGKGQFLGHAVLVV